MSNDNINDQILSTYNSNIEFLKTFHQEIYNKIQLLESVLQTQKYELEYKENYFDVYQQINGSFLYNQNSNKYSKDIIEKMTFDENSDNFKPYKPMSFDDSYMSKIDDVDIMAGDLIGLAPIVHYTNKNSQRDQSFSSIDKFIFFGVGLGLHINEVQNKFHCKVYFICEPDLELFRLSLFTTPYYKLRKSSKLIFSVSDTNKEFEDKCDIFLEQRYMLNYNIKFNLFSQEASFLINIFKNKVIQQNFLIYSYERRYMSNERPLKYIMDKCVFLDVCTDESRKTVLSDYPVLILASGPSLLKNIKWLIDNHSKFIIITVSANIHLLYQYNIKPDVIIHIDENKEKNIEDFSRVDMEFFKDAISLLSSIIHPDVYEIFEKNRKFMIQATSAYYKNLGRLFLDQAQNLILINRPH